MENSIHKFQSFSDSIANNAAYVCFKNHKDLCLYDNGPKKTASGKQCKNENQQKWKIIPHGNGKYFIQSFTNKQVFDVLGADFRTFAKVALYPKGSGPINQLWNIVKVDKERFQIKSAKDNSLCFGGNSLVDCNKYLKESSYMMFYWKN